jgi:hypothetical protein
MLQRESEMKEIKEETINTGVNTKVIFNPAI